AGASTGDGAGRISVVIAGECTGRSFAGGPHQEWSAGRDRAERALTCEKLMTAAAAREGRD
ncbi:MAG TPA: hypothetical protein VIB02_03495, partial [Candidatus Limnocylindrales bacterium]